MTLRKAFIFALFLIPSPCLANMVISNAPRPAGGGGGCVGLFNVVTGSTVTASTDDGTQLTTTMALTASTSAIVDATNEYAAYRFTQVSIPETSTITLVNFSAYFPDGALDEPEHTVYFYLGSTGTLTAAASNISNRVPTTSSVTWSSANLAAPDRFYSPNLTTQLKAVYDLTGSISNYGLLLVVRGGATGTRDYATLMWDNAQASQYPMLGIEYTSGTLCGGAADFTDTFTEAVNISLALHVSGVTTWTKRDTSANTMDVAAANDNVWNNGAGTDAFGYYNSSTPADADYCGEGDIVTDNTAANTLGVSIRNETGAQTGYFTMYAGSTGWQLFKVVAGVVTQLGSTYNGDDPSIVKSARLCATGTSLTVYIAGVPRITATDSAISAAGKIGIYSHFAGISANSTLDNLELYETVAAP